MFEKTDRFVRLLSFAEDQPTELRGSLIPQGTLRPTRGRVSLLEATAMSAKLVTSVLAVGVFLFVAVSGYGLVQSSSQAAAPTVTIVDPQTLNRVPLGYGQQAALSQAQFFEDTRTAFIEEAVSFIEVDLDTRLLRFFDKGVLTVSAEIESLPEEGSWWDVPSGLYQVERLTELEFSSAAQAYLPHSVIFEGNYVIHGTPEYPNHEPVRQDFTAGGIRLSSETAATLFAQVKKGVPVLVHQEPSVPDQFVYEPTVPALGTPQYLIADLENGAVLAASDLNQAAPIASLTKLMTAVVAAEVLDLDSRVQVTAPTFVESLIPRLADRTSVSMYSLLQLLLVESSNEAAEVIAGQYGRTEFIVAMNNKATALGMTQSHFEDPSGLAAGNSASLGDLFTLSKYIDENRSFIFEITAEGALSSLKEANEFDNLSNFNRIAHVDNFVGGKVGETTAAGQTSISLHTVMIQGSKRTVVVILLGSASRSEDIKTLLAFVEDRYKR